MLLSRDNFKEWLKAKDYYEIVGDRALPRRCPIVTYVKDKLNEANISFLYVKVTNMLEYETAEGDTISSRLPQWAEEFVYGIDKPMYEEFTHEAMDVTAEEALEVLDAIE